MAAASFGPEMTTQLMSVLYVILLVIYYKKLTLVMVMVSAGVGCLLYAFELSAAIALGGASAALVGMSYTSKSPEGFNTNTPPPEIVNTIRQIKKPSQPMIEGYEDVKKEKNEVPAPAKESMAVPFKLGEIPSQVKNGPHIDAASTLVKAINSLNPEQIKAMSKDTQQLIDTQKSLMGMLGSMKPMLNDGKELMNTFQEMFGKT